MQSLRNCKGCHAAWQCRYLKMVLMMKLITVLSLACLSSAARGYTQSISFSFKKAPLQVVFNAIEQQSGYSFIYSRETIAHALPVTLSVQEEPLAVVLKRCFSRQPLSYSIDDKFIIVKRSNAGNKDTVAVLPGFQGKLLTDDNEPVSGATILVKQTNESAVSDKDGNFFFNNISPDAILVISGAEMETIEVPLRGRFQLTIRCKRKTSILDETVVIAYGKTTRRLNTGNVSKVSGEDMRQQPVQDPIAGLAGRVAGLMITQQNGLPGSNFTVQIRGQNSIQSGNSPLFLIDGVPFLNNSEGLTQYSSIFASSPFNTISPQDIESIEVLKDADATAIYGSRGANGVILITTRKAKDGRLQFNMDINRGAGKVAHITPYLSTPDYLLMRREAFRNDGVTPVASNAYDFLVWDSTRNTNFGKQLIGGTSSVFNGNLNLSGGNAHTSFITSLNYFRTTTVFPGSNSDNKITASLKLSHHSADKRLQLDITTGYALDRNHLIPQDLTQYINMSPTTPVLFDSSGKLNWSEGGYTFFNPYSLLLNKYNVNTERLTANAVFSYRVLKAITLRLNSGFNSLLADETITTPISSLNPAYGAEGSATFAKNTVRSWILEPQVEYVQPTTVGRFSLMAGATWQGNANLLSSVNAYGFTNDALLYSVSAAHDVYAENERALYRYMAGFARFSYSYKDKYLLNVTGRRDGSSRFGPGKRFGNFGAVGAAWLFASESFFQKMFPFISYGKLRGSYGVTGNDQIGNYQFLDAYTASYFQYQEQPVLVPERLFNSNFNWERNKKLEAALELGLTGNRVLFTLSWYRNRSDNQLIYYLLPAQTGFYNVLRNFPGIVENRGWEVDINTVNIKNRRFQWTSSFNLSIPKNRLVAFPGLASSSYSYLYREGKPLNSLIGLGYEGVNPATGVYQFTDRDKDGSITDNDYEYQGHFNPVYFGGLMNSFHFKNLALQFHFLFVKQMGQHPVRYAVTVAGNATNQPGFILDRWQQPGDEASYQQFSQKSYGSLVYTGARNASNSAAAITDASFIRLRNLSLSYTLPAGWLRKISLAQCRLYIQGQNLLTFTRYKGLDPETKSIRSLPPLRVFTAGIQFTF